MPQFKKVRLINPARRKTKKPKANKFRARRQRNASGQFTRRRTASSTRRRRRTAARRMHTRVSRRRATAPQVNPLGEELILLSNPRRKRKKSTSSYHPRRRNPFARHRRRSNPFHRSSHYRRRRNPDFGRAKSFAVEGVKAIVSGAVGAVGTRAIVQGVLGNSNTGMMGYFANLFVALGGGWALWYFTKSKAIALGWAVGGAANTVQRIWSEKVSMTSPAAAAPQLSDLDYSSNGMGGVGLSGYVNTQFYLPSVTDGGGVIAAPAVLPGSNYSTPGPAGPIVGSGAGSQPGGNVLNIPAGNVARFAPRY